MVKSVFAAGLAGALLLAPSLIQSAAPAPAPVSSPAVAVRRRASRPAWSGQAHPDSYYVAEYGYPACAREDGTSKSGSRGGCVWVSSEMGSHPAAPKDDVTRIYYPDGSVDEYR